MNSRKITRKEYKAYKEAANYLEISYTTYESSIGNDIGNSLDNLGEYPWDILLLKQEKLVQHPVTRHVIRKEIIRRCPEFETKLYENQLNLIHLASEYRYVDIVRELISISSTNGGMNPCLCLDEDSKTPLDYAAMKGNTEIIHLLLDALSSSAATSDEKMATVKKALYLSLRENQREAFRAIAMKFMENWDANKVDIIKAKNKLLIGTPSSVEDVPTEVFDDLNENLLSAIRNDRGGIDYLQKFLASDPGLFRILSSGSCPLQTQFYFCVFARQTDDLVDEINKMRHELEPAEGLDDVDKYPMHKFSSYGYIEIVNLILVYQSGSSSVCLLKNMDGNTPLHCAAQSGKISVINILLSNCWECAWIVSDKKKETAIHSALRKSKAKAFKTLLRWYIIKEEFSNNSARDWDHGDTALDLVEAYGKIVKNLFSQRESKVCFQREYWGGKDYFVVIKCKKNESMETFFKYRDFIKEVTSKITNRTVLSLSVDSRSIVTLKVLIRSVMIKEILDVKDVDGKTVFDLLDKTDQVRTTNVMGFVQYERYENVICLLDAMQMGDYEVFSRLQVEDPWILDYLCQLHLGGTPLHIAMRFGQLNDCTREIIRTRPDFVRKEDRKGRYPIHIASADGSLDIVEELLDQYGLDQCFATTEEDEIFRDEFNGTPLDYAIQRGRISIINVLLPIWWKCAGAISKEGNSTLLRSALNGKHFEAFKILMERYIEYELLKAKKVDGSQMSALADGYIEIILKLLCPKIDYSLWIIVKDKDDEETMGIESPLPLYFAVIKVTSSTRRKDINIVEELQLSAYYPKYFREVTVQDKMVLHLLMEDKDSVTLKLLLQSPLFYEHYDYGDGIFQLLEEDLENEVVQNEMETHIPIWSNKITDACLSSSIKIFDGVEGQRGEGSKNGHEEQLSVSAKEDHGVEDYYEAEYVGNSPNNLGEYPWDILLLIQETPVEDPDSRQVIRKEIISRCPEFKTKLYEDQLNLIHLASEYRYVDIVRELISISSTNGGMNPCLCLDEDSKTPLDYAAMKGNTEIIHLLLDALSSSAATSDEKMATVKKALYLSLRENQREAFRAIAMKFMENWDANKVDIIKAKNKLLMGTPRSSSDVPTNIFESLNVKLVSAIRRDSGGIVSLKDFLATDPLLFGTLSSRSCPLLTQFYFCVLTKQTDDLVDEINKMRHEFEPHEGLDEIDNYPMHSFASYGYNDIVKLILVYESGSSSVSLLKDMDGNTPLHCAAQKGKVSVINTLLENCWECAGMVSDKMNETALHCALRNNKAKAFKTLLGWYIIKEEFLNNNARDWDCGDTPFYLLVDGYVKIVKELFGQRDSKVCFQRDQNSEPMYFAVIKCKNKRSNETSFEYHDYIREVTSKITNQKILSLSVDSRSIITMKVLIRSVKVRDMLDYFKDVDEKTVFDLLDKTEQVRPTNVMGFVQYEMYENAIRLLDVMEMGEFEVFSKLVEEDQLALDNVWGFNFGGTPLHISMRFGELNNCTREIIKNWSCYATMEDRKGRNPLHIASAKGSLDIVQELLTQYGLEQCFASTEPEEFRDGFLGTPLDNAIKRGRISVIDELLPIWWNSAGVKGREENSTPLRSAANSKNFEAFKILMERYIKNELSKAKKVDGSPMSALADGYIEIVAKLLCPEVDYSLSIIVKDRDDEETMGTESPLPLYFASIKVTSSTRRMDTNIVDEIQLSAYYPKYFREVTVQNKMVLHLWVDNEVSVTLKLLLQSPLFYEHYDYGDGIFQLLEEDLENEVVQNEMETHLPIWSNKITDACLSSSIKIFDGVEGQRGEGSKNGHEGVVANGDEEQLSVPAKEGNANFSKIIKADHINLSVEDDNEEPHDQEMLIDKMDGCTIRDFNEEPQDQEMLAYSIPDGPDGYTVIKKHKLGFWNGQSYDSLSCVSPSSPSLWGEQESGVVEQLSVGHRNNNAEEDNEEPHDQQMLIDKMDAFTIRDQDISSSLINQSYESLEECRDAIKDAAILDKTELTFTKSSSERIVAACSKSGCDWKIRAKAEKKTNNYVVQKIENKHTCQRLNGTTNKMATPIWVSSHIIDSLRQDHSISTQQIKHIMKKSKFQIDISRKTAERAKRKALRELETVPKKQRPNSIASSSLSSIARQSWSNLRFFEQISGPAMHKYIHSTQDVEKDGHCGYRVVALQSGYKETDAWKRVRIELLTEIDQNEELYVKLMGIDTVAKMKKSFHYFEDHATDPCYWLSFPDAGYVIANAYKAVVVSLSLEHGNLTFLPLVEPPPEGRPHRMITLGFINGNHFISLILKPDAPIPQVDPRWKFHVSEGAKVWKTPYQSRFKKFEELIGFNLARRGNTSSVGRPIILDT